MYFLFESLVCSHFTAYTFWFFFNDIKTFFDKISSLNNLGY